MDSTHSQPAREPVLVLVHSDGFLEVFGPRHVDVKVVDVPFVDGSAAGEIAAEEYVTLTLPLKYRDVYWPDCKRAMHMPRVVRPSDIAHTQWSLELLRAIQAIEPSDIPIAEATWKL